MKVLLLAAGLTLAFATTAFAQDAAPASPASPADASAPASSGMPVATKHHAKKHHAMKHHGHVAGDPAVVDHSDDKMVVTPTESKVTLPPSH